MALSGGVARGFAHIGVLKVLKKYNIPVQYLSGTSVGALVSVFYAAGMEPEVIETNAKKLGWFRFLRLERLGPLSIDEIKKLIVENIGDKKFSDLKIPLAIVATDLKSGIEVILSEGRVAAAVAASCAFPGIFSPVKQGEYLLVDGGLINNVPSSVVRWLGADFVVAVDVVPGRTLKRDPENPLQVFGRSLDIVMKRLSVEGRKLAQVLIEPEIPEDVWQLDIDDAPRLIKVGEEAAEKKILEIKTKLAF